MANDHPYVRSPRNESRSSFNKTTSFQTGSHRQSAAPSLQKGQTFQGQVTNITARDITIQLSDGRNVTARYENAPDLLIGDTAAFRVLSADERGITLQTLMQGGNAATKNITILKALEAASLPVTERNVSMVTSLLSHNMPINAQMLNHMLQQSFRNPDISLPNLISMYQLGLPVNPETTQLYENYDNMLHQLLPEMETAVDGFLNELAALLDQNSPDAAIGFAAKLLSIPEDLSFGETMPSGESIPAAGMTDLPPADTNAGSFTPGIPGLDLSGTEFSGAVDTAVSAGSLLSGAASELTDPAQILRTASTPGNADHVIADDSAVNGTAADSSINSREALASLLREWSHISLPDENVTSADLLRALRTLLPENSTALQTAHLLSGTKEGLRELLSHPSFRKFTRELFLRNWTLAPEELPEKDSVKKLYERLNSQTEKLTQLLSEAGSQSGQTAKDNLAGMRQNLGFMNMINDMYQYVQLPLRLTQETAHGDLYVYTNRKNRGQQDGSFSCLLHLDLNRLGSVDVRIQLTGKQVTAKFYLEDKLSASLIQSHLPELDKAVNSRGYQFTSEAILSDNKKEDASLEKKLLGQTESSSDVYRYSFDVRA